MARACWEVEGIEPSAHAAHQAMEAGYKVRNVSLEAAGDPQLPFDLIVGWMVLEHLHQPLDVLQKLRSWVRPDGWLVLSVPDAGGLERSEEHTSELQSLMRISYAVCCLKK